MNFLKNLGQTVITVLVICGAIGAGSAIVEKAYGVTKEHIDKE